MIGSTNAYKDYFKEEDDFDEEDYFYRKRKRRNKIILIVLSSIVSLFLVFSIVACTIGVKNNPYVQYDLTERNDFNKNYTDSSVIEEYYP